MNAYEQLKLDIYESGLDFEDCKEIVNIMESCTDDEAEEVIEAVLDLVEESNMSDVEKVANALENHPKKTVAAASVAAASSALVANGSFRAVTGGGSYAINNIKLKKLKDDLKKCTKELSTERAPSKQKALESRIDKIQNKIRACEAKMEKGKKRGISGLKRIGAGEAANIAAGQYIRSLGKDSKSKTHTESADSLTEIIEVIDSISN